MAANPSSSRNFTRIREVLAVSGSIVSIFVFGMLGGCAKPFNPFQVPSEDVRRSVSNIAMAPAYVPQTMMSLADARATFEPVATARLETAGFHVIPSETWAELWKQAATDVGGVYDASTGAVDEERFLLVREAVYRALENGHDAHAVLYLNVALESLYLTGSHVRFCGGDGKVYFPSEGSEEPDLYLDVTMVRAACVSANLYDMETRYLYGIRHALEIIETYAEQTRAVRPEGERLKDPAQIEEALEAIVGPLADGAGPSPRSH